LPLNLPFEDRLKKTSFDLLQIRPMGITHQQMDIEIHPEDIAGAFCYSTMALGNGHSQEMTDIVFVNPDRFDPARTVEIAGEIGQLNGQLVQQGRKYLLIGPGRWGSADRWLGIPVRWNDISGVGAMVETATELLKADPSQGTHFFHNITSLGISYLTTSQNGTDFVNWQWLQSRTTVRETKYLKQVRLEKP
jgi:hypothetical protein